MPATVRPSPGQYRFSTTNPTTSVIYGITMAGVVTTTFGTLPWVSDGEGENNGHFQRGTIGVTLFDDGSFVGSNGSETFTGTWAPA